MHSPHSLRCSLFPCHSGFRVHGTEQRLSHELACLSPEQEFKQFIFDLFLARGGSTGALLDCETLFVVEKMSPVEQTRKQVLINLD